MKKRKIISISVIIVILVIVIALVIHNLLGKSGKHYEIATIEKYNYFVLKQNDLMGVIGTKGETIIPAKYDEIKIPNPQMPIFVCYKDEKIEVYNEKNEKILTQYEKVEPIRLQNVSGDLMYEKSVLTYQENGKYGIIDFNGKKKTKPIYDEIASLTYKEGELLVKQGEKYGVININGYKVIETLYDEISVDKYYTDEHQYKNAGYIISNKTEEGYRYGYIDKDAKLIEEPKYNELSRITQIEDDENEYLLCAENGKYGILKNKEQVIPNDYQSISYDGFNELFVVEKSKKYGITTLNGKVIVPIQYDQIDITGIYMYAQNSQGTTVYNSEGKQVSIDKNIAVLRTKNDEYKIKINNEQTTKYGLVNKNEQTLIEEKYNYLEYLYDDLFLASNENSKLGVINNKDEQKVEIKYDSLQQIQNSKVLQATLSQEKMTHLYSSSMKNVCEMKNASIEVKDNYIKIYNEVETKYFDFEGNELQNTKVFANNKLFSSSKDGKWGFIDSSSKVVVEYKYDRVTEFNEYGFAGVLLDGKWGVINENGEEVLAPTYELEGNLNPSFINKYYQVQYGFGEIYYTDDKK